jgi:hypothetical protein
MDNFEDGKNVINQYKKNFLNFFPKVLDKIKRGLNE